MTYSFVSTEPSIRPRLIFGFDFTQSNKPNAPILPTGLSALELGDFAVELKLVPQNSGNMIYVGYLIPRQPFVTLPANVRTNLTFNLDLDHHELREIEKLREAKDLNLLVNFFFTAENQSQPKTKTMQSAQIIIKVPKSDWVEKFLPDLGVKTVSLIEIPQLIGDSEFSETISHVDDAWKQYSMGEYHRVLTDCRKAIECLAEKIKSKGFVKEEIAQEGKKIIVPDWDKFLVNEELGDVVATINKKISRITATGAHPGRIICREDADFTLMTTHAMVNLILRKYSLNCV